MASELSMNGKKKIETFQKEFTQKFSYLTLVFLDKERRAIDISKSLSEVRQVKGEDISIIASLKVNTLEKRFLANFGLIVEVAYQKTGKVVYTKDNVDKTLNELNKWCEENDCQPFEFKKTFTGNTLLSIQEQLFEAIKVYYPNAETKKINKDNYLDIYVPEINKKRGTHLFFNTAKDGIKIGFYCRDEEFVENVMSNSSNIEKYAQGIRILNNPLQDDVEKAIESALNFIEVLTGEKKENNSAESDEEDDELDLDAILDEMGLNDKDEEKEEEKEEISNEEDQGEDVLVEEEEDNVEEEEEDNVEEEEEDNLNILTNNYPIESYKNVKTIKEIIVTDSEQIKFVPKELLDDENILIELINTNNNIFSHLPIEIKNKKGVNGIAIQAGFYDEALINNIDINNSELLEKIITKAPLYFKLLPDSKKSVNLTRIAIIKCNEIEFDDLPKSIQSDIGFFEDLLVSISKTLKTGSYDYIFPGSHYAESIVIGYSSLFRDDSEFILKYNLMTYASGKITENKIFCFEFLNKWRSSFQEILENNSSLKVDLEFIKLGLTYDRGNLGNLDDDIINNELIDFAITNGKGVIGRWDIPDKLLYYDEQKKEPKIDLLTLILENNPYKIEDISEEIRYNNKYAKSLIWAARNNRIVLYYAPKFLTNDKIFIKELFDVNPLSIVFADSSIFSDFKFMCDIIKVLPIIVKFCSKTLQQNKSFILKALSENGLVYKYILEDLQSDPDVYWMALKQNVNSFTYFPSSLQENQLILEYVSKHNGALIENCANLIKSKTIKFNAYLNSENNTFNNQFIISKSFDELKNDIDLINIIKNDITQIVFLTEQFLNQDRDRLLQILQYTPYPLQYKSCRVHLQQNELNQYLKQSPWFFKFLDEDEKLNVSIIKELLSINGLLIQYLSKEQKQDMELVEIALRQNTNACKYLSLEINWEDPKAKSIAIEMIYRDPSQISYFIHLDNLNIDSNLEELFYYAFALDVSVLYLINPERSNTDYETTPMFISNVYGEYELSESDLILGLNQDSQFFDFEPISNISKNICISISQGREYEWGDLFKSFDDDKEIIETAFKYFPEEETYKALKKIIGNKIESTEYVNSVSISENPNLYSLIPNDLKNKLDFGLALIRGNGKIGYSEKFDILSPNFKNNKEFLNSISELKIDFKILDLFFETEILHDEDFILTYLVNNYSQYTKLPKLLKENRSIALSYGINNKDTTDMFGDAGLTDLELPDKFKRDKTFLLEIFKGNLFNNLDVIDDVANILVSERKFLFDSIQFQPQLINRIDKEILTDELIVDLLKININIFDYLEPEQMLLPEVFDFIVKSDLKKIKQIKYTEQIDNLIQNLNEKYDLMKVINMFESEKIIKSIAKLKNIETLSFNSKNPEIESGIKTLYFVNENCEFTIGYDQNCYLSEDIAGKIPYEIIEDYLDSDESWSNYIFGNSWYNYDDIYHTYGISEPATDMKLPNGEMVSINLQYQNPEFTNDMIQCFEESDNGDFVQISSSNEKSYTWEGWKRYSIDVSPGIFDVNKIEVQFEGNIVDGYDYRYSDGLTESFVEIEMTSTTGQGFSSDLFFNNGKALVNVDIDELKEALSDAGIEYNEHVKIKDFCNKFYKNRKA